jgi:cyclic lactone autoinducer peptide
MKKAILTLMGAVVTLLAFANIAAACGPYGYQPEVPANLRK